jgi:hypothetical protein
MAIGWTSQSHSVRKGFDFSVDITARNPSGENRGVHSKNTVRHGRNSTTGSQPAELHRDLVNPDAVIVHNNATEIPHKETVGWMDGVFHTPTHPNAERRAAGGATRTHAGLEPAGMTFSKTGGEHGKPQTRPESRGHGGKTARLGELNTVRDFNRKRSGKR